MDDKISNRAKPNFLIAGAPKCGTTSLYKWLALSDQVFMPENKEPSLFLDHYGYTSLSDYLDLFESAARVPLRGEASAGYLAAPESPALIHQALPDIKIIVILRDPAHRAFSAWCWMVMEGSEPITVFAKALDAETERFDDPNFKNTAPQYFMDYMYFHVGLYAEQLQRYYSLFDRDQIKVLLFDDMLKDSRAVYVECCDFLGVAPLSDADTSAKNVSVIPSSIRAQYQLRRLNMYALKHPHLWYSQLLTKATSALMTKNLNLGIRPVRDPDIDARLRARYKASNTQLSRLIGRDLSAWG